MINFSELSSCPFCSVNVGVVAGPLIPLVKPSRAYLYQHSPCLRIPDQRTRQLRSSHLIHTSPTPTCGAYTIYDGPHCVFAVQ
jgi:hypothetical protein